MHRSTIKAFFLVSSVIGLVFTDSYTQDNFPASKSPPNGLGVSRVPQFVNIGFDDNGYADGMTWITDFLRDKKNPAGNNNPGTFDGTPARVVFYMTTYYGADDEAVKNSWIQAYNDSHEIGNHTVTHYEAMAGWTQEQWETELDSANRWMFEHIGIPKEEIWGFRTPFLAFSYMGYTHYAVKDVGLIYDCTLNAGSEIIGDGTDFYWPYTMDNGSPDEHYIKEVPGLWQVPVHYVMVSSGGRMTGFDYNLWVDLRQSKSSFYATLKKTLDLRYNGNRAPFCFGGHTDYYSEFNETANSQCTGAGWQARREAVEEFLLYALSLPDVRVVTSVDIIKWLRNPIALDQVTAWSGGKSVTNNKLSVQVLPQGRILLCVPSASRYTVKLLTASGREVGPARSRFFTPGAHSLTYDHKIQSRGVYFLSVRGNSQRVVEKILLQ